MPPPTTTLRLALVGPGLVGSAFLELTGYSDGLADRMR